MKKLVFISIFLGAIALKSFGQGYHEGMIFGGPTVGFNYFKVFGYTFAMSGEYGIGMFKENFSIGGDVGFGWRTKKYNYNLFGVNWYEYSYRTVFLVPTIAYHLKPGEKLDPYARVGIGLFTWFWKYKDSKGSSIPVGQIASEHGNFELSPVIIGGIRYWPSENFAIRAEAGYPFLTQIGIDFVLK